MTIYSGTAISAIANASLTQTFEPSQQFLDRLADLGRVIEEVTVCTVLVGVHTQQSDGKRERIVNPDAISDVNQWTYFVEVALPLIDLVPLPNGRIGYAQAVLSTHDSPIEIFFKPSGITSRLVYLAEGMTPKTRPNGKPVRLMGGNGEVLHVFDNAQFDSVYLPEAERAKRIHPDLRVLIG